MDQKCLAEWLNQLRLELTQAVTQCVRDHVNALRLQGVHFYGYALMSGGPYDISSVVAAYNRELDINVPKDNEQYRYHYFSVDEWAHYGHDHFEPVKEQLEIINTKFAGMHQKGEDEYEIDEFEISRARSLLESILQGIEASKAEGVFSKSGAFLVIWISDSSEPILAESVRRLNSPGVFDEFMKGFG